MLGRGPSDRSCLSALMGNKNRPRCAYLGCTKQPLFGKAGSKAKFCRGHSKGGMVDVKNKSCRQPGCTKASGYGKTGSNAEFYRDHAEEGMVNVISIRNASTVAAPSSRHT